MLLSHRAAFGGFLVAAHGADGIHYLVRNLGVSALELRF